MNGDYINIHVRSKEAAPVRQAVSEILAQHGFQPVGDEAAPNVVDDEDALPPGDDWYGVMVGAGTDKWTSVYVEDWQDSGVLAKGLSALLQAPTLEIWVVEDAHWGYTYYEGGEVKDRFADDPQKVAETPQEAASLQGRSEVLTPILGVTGSEFEHVLRNAQAGAGEFVGPVIDALAQSVGLPFDHIMIGYESFFADDPDDYEDGLERWRQWRHLAFRHPQGNEQLAE